MLFTLKTWGSGKYAWRLLAIILTSLYCEAFAQLNVGPIGLLVVWPFIKPLIVGGMVLRFVILILIVHNLDTTTS
jgi:hypothetical protein